MNLIFCKKSILFIFILLFVLFFQTLQISAHHGWGWANDEEFEITGKILNVQLGMPHGVVTIEVNGQNWLIEIGQPWRNEEAGLYDSMLEKGRIITIHGHRSSNKNKLLVKAERIIIDGKVYNLYPDRK